MRLPIFLYYQSKKGWQGFAKDFRAALWLIIYLPTMALLSYLGSNDFGGSVSFLVAGTCW